MPILKRSKTRGRPEKRPKPEPAKAKAPAQKVVIKTQPPDHPFDGMECCQVGGLAPGTGFYFPEGYQFLTGLVLYHSICSSYCRMRGVRPITHDEFVEDMAIAGGSWVLVKQEDYDAQKAKSVSASAIRREPGMEGFPKI